MACDQIEYCGECKFYAKCMERAEHGRLTACKLDEKDKKHD